MSAEILSQSKGGGSMTNMADLVKALSGVIVERDAALARAERAEKALEPFAAWIGKLEPKYGDHADDVIAGGVGDAVVTFGDLRGARAALAHPAPAEEEKQ